MKINLSTTTASFDGMAWPRTNEVTTEIAWRLRYNKATHEDLLFAASVMAAYHSLIWKSQKSRNEICSTLQKLEVEGGINPGFIIDELPSETEPKDKP